MADSDKLRNRLKVLRAERDLTQGELARRVGVTRKTINTVENGVFAGVEARPLLREGDAGADDAARRERGGGHPGSGGRRGLAMSASPPAAHQDQADQHGPTAASAG